MCTVLDAARLAVRSLAIIPGVAIALAMTMSLAIAEATSPPWLAEFYQQNPACTAATVQSIAPDSRQIVVGLAVEPATRDALVSMHPSDRRNWIALHCPPEHRLLAPGAKQAIANNKVNVTIQTWLSSAEPEILNCSAYFASQYQQSAASESRFLEKLQRLLGRVN